MIKTIPQIIERQEEILEHIYNRIEIYATATAAYVIQLKIGQHGIPSYLSSSKDSSSGFHENLADTPIWTTKTSAEKYRKQVLQHWTNYNPEEVTVQSLFIVAKENIERHRTVIETLYIIQELKHENQAS